jgi:hypothetical protein
MKKVLLLLLVFAFCFAGAQCPVTPVASSTICSGACAVLSATGATSYTWMPGGFTGATCMVCPSVTTVYTVTGTTGTCTATGTVVLTVAPSPTANISTSPATCGNANGSATVTVSGGQGAITYTWAPSGANSATISNLAPGTYTASVTDANGCSDTAVASVPNASTPTVSPTITNVSCNSACDGSVTVNVSGGNPPYSYFWNSGISTTASVTGVCAGCYTCTVTDVNGCVSTTIACVTQPSAMTVSASSSSSPLCPAQSATLTALVSGGNPGYTYTWTPIGSTQNTVVVNPSVTGTYTVAVTDANGCTGVAAVTVLVNSPSVSFSVVPTPTPQVWNVVANYSGGTQPYTYGWFWGDGSSDTIAYPNHNYASAGWYNICCEITDANGCMDSVCQLDSVYKSAGSMITVNVISGSTGIQASKATTLAVYPVPARDAVEVNPGFEESYKLELLSMEGRVLLTKEARGATSLDLSRFSGGTYLLQLHAADGKMSRKLVVVQKE